LICATAAVSLPALSSASTLFAHSLARAMSCPRLALHTAPNVVALAKTRGILTSAG
jgi:hypothetical protein